MSLARTLAIGVGAYVAAGIVTNVIVQHRRDKVIAAGPPLPAGTKLPNLVTPQRVAIWPLIALFPGGMK